MELVLGGPTWPIAWSLGFIQAPLSEVVAAWERWQDSLEQLYERETLRDKPLLEQLARLPPLESPHTRRLLVATDSGWTAYFDNALLGGDPAPWVGVLSEQLTCRGVIATHIPPAQYAYPATQFELLGPEGTPSLRYVRTVAAGIFDSGRWSFEERGDVQPFEEAERYERARIRERLTREMLVRYLAALTIRVDDPAYYGDGLLLEEQVSYDRHVLTLNQAREQYRRTTEQ